MLQKKEVRVRDLLNAAWDNNTQTVSNTPDGIHKYETQLMCQGNNRGVSLPEPVLALLWGELVKCFGLLFAQKGLMVVLEAFIIFVGLPNQFRILIKDSIFP